MARIAMERMMEDLESVYIQKTNQPDSPEGEKESSLQFLGEEREMMGRRADALRFASSAHVDFSGKDPGYGATQISYYVKEINEGETFVLYRAENPLFKETYPFEEGSGGLVLCEGLTWISFTYYGEDGQASNNWDSTREDMKDKIPKTVSITL